MSKYLITTTEVYRVDDEIEVQNLIEEAKHDPMYTLVKYNREYKEKKSKGEVIDEWYKVTLVKSFNNEKEPERHINVMYKGE
jgi:hypothetical protein